MTKEINIQKHVIVPKHEIMKEEEVTKMLKMFNVTKSQLPKIPHSDPIVKILDAQVNDIIKITRQSDTNVKSPYYRVVVNE